MTGRVFLELVIIGGVTAIAAELYYLLVVRPWLRNRRHAIEYDRDRAAHRKAVTAAESSAEPDEFWGDTSEHDALYAHALAEARSEQTQELEPLPSQPWARAWEPQPRTQTVNHAPWDSAQFPAITDLPGVPSNGKHARQHNLPGGALTSADMTPLAAGEPDLLQPAERIPWPVTVINLTIVRQQVIMPPLHEAYERTAGYGDTGWQPAQAGIYTGSLQYVQDILDAEYVDGQLMLEGAA